MSIIYADNVTKNYGDLTALDKVSITIDTGEIHGILGPNGAGKTTLIHQLTGVESPEYGQVEVLDADIIENPTDGRKNIGVLPAKENPPTFLTIGEFFDFVKDVRDITIDVFNQQRDKWEKIVQLDQSRDTLIRDLSRGQKQKVLIISMFLHDPELVYIDEPFANLDPIVQKSLRQGIKEYNENGGTVVLSTHDIEVAVELCSQVSILVDGNIRETLNLDEMGREEILEVMR